MRELTPTDLRFVVGRIPKDVAELLKTSGLILGGGFIRETISGGKVSDIDLFGANGEQLQLAAGKLFEARHATNVQARRFATGNAITLLSPPRLPVQFITRWQFDSPEACVASFDFTVCQAIVWRDVQGNWFSMCADDFYTDLAARRLVYTFPVREEEAGGSMMRVRKFLARGYNIQPLSLGGVISRLCSKVIEERLRGDTTADREKDRALVLAGLLREVDPLAVVDGLEPIDEHDTQ